MFYDVVISVVLLLTINYSSVEMTETPGLESKTVALNAVKYGIADIVDRVKTDVLTMHGISSDGEKNAMAELRELFRKRRQASPDPYFGTGDAQSSWKLVAVKPEICVPTFPTVVDMKVETFRGNAYVLVVTALEDQTSVVKLIRQKEWGKDLSLVGHEIPRLNSSVEPFLKFARTVELFVTNGKLLALVLINSQGAFPDDDGILVFSLHEEQLVYGQRIGVQNPSSMSVWCDPLKGNAAILSVAVEYLLPPGYSTPYKKFRTNATVYRYEGMHWDEIGHLETTGSKAVKTFQVNNEFYAVTANFQDDHGSVDIMSEIFKWRSDTKQFQHFQYIATHGATYWEYFTVVSGKKTFHFLAVANSETNGDNRQRKLAESSDIFIFSGLMFEKFQTVELEGVTQVVHYVDSKGQFCLIYLSHFTGLTFLQWTGWKFAESDMFYTQEAASNGLVKISVGRMTRGPVVALVNPLFSKGCVANVVSLQFSFRNQLGIFQETALHWCEQAMFLIENLKTKALEEIVSKAFHVDDPQLLFSGPVQIRGNLTNRGNTIAQQILDQGASRKESDSTAEMDSFTAQISGIKSDVREASEILDAIENFQAFPTSANQTKFKVKCPIPCNLRKLKFSTLNGVSARQFLDDVLWINQPTYIPRLYLHKVTVLEELEIRGKLGSFRPTSFLSKKRDGFVLGKKHFKGTVAVSKKGLVVHGKIGGMLLDSSHVLTTSAGEEQTVLGDISIAHLASPEISVQYVNHHTMQSIHGRTSWLDSLILKNSSKTIRINGLLECSKNGNLNFSQDLSTLLLNGRTFDQLYEGSLKKRSPVDTQIVRGMYRVQWLNVTGSLTFPPKQDSLGARVDFLGQSVSSSSIAMDQDVKISGDFRCRHLTVLGSLNGVPTENGKLLVARLNSSDDFQVFRKPVSFSMGFFSNDVLVQETFNDRFLRNLGTAVDDSEFALENATFVTVAGDVIFEQGVSFDSVNYRRITSTLSELIPTNAELPQFKTVIFLDSVETENLTSVDVNGQSSSDWVAKINPVVNFLKPVEFVGDVLVNSDVVVQTVYDHDIRETFEDSLRAFDAPVTIRGAKTIRGSVQMASITGSKIALNGKDLLKERKVGSEREADRFSDIVFSEGFSVSDLNIQEDLSFGGLKKVDLSDTLLHAALDNRNVPVQLLGSRVFESNITAAVVESPVSLGWLSSLLVTACLRDEPCSFNSVKVNKKTVLHNASVEKFSPYLDRDVEGDTFDFLEVFGDVFVKEVTITSDTLNGIPLSRIRNDALKDDEPFVAVGKVTFDSVDVKRVAVLNGRLNGKDIEKFANLRRDNVFKGSLNFEAGIGVEGNVYVHDLLNNRPVPIVNGSRVPVLHKKITSRRIVVDGDVVFKEEPEMDRINDQNVEDLLEQIWIQGLPTTLKAPIKFLRAKIEDVVLSDNRLGNLSIDRASQQFVSAVSETGQVINSSVTISDELIVEDSFVLKSFHANVINGHSINDFAEPSELSTLPPRTSARVCRFKEDVSTEALNDLNPKSDLVRKSMKEVTFRGSKTFGNLTITGAFNTGPQRKVSNVDLSQWIASVYQKNGTYSVNGQRFENVECPVGTVVRGKLNGQSFTNETFLMRTGDQFGSAQLVFPGIEVDDLVVTGLINGILDLSGLPSRVARKNRNNFVSGEVEFLSDASVSVMQLPGEDLEFLEEVDAILEKGGLGTRDLLNLASDLANVPEQLSTVQQLVTVNYFYEYQRLEDIPTETLTYLPLIEILVAMCDSSFTVLNISADTHTLMAVDAVGFPTFDSGWYDVRDVLVGGTTFLFFVLHPAVNSTGSPFRLSVWDNGKSDLVIPLFSENVFHADIIETATNSDGIGSIFVSEKGSGVATLWLLGPAMDNHESLVGHKKFDVQSEMPVEAASIVSVSSLDLENPFLLCVCTRGKSPLLKVFRVTESKLLDLQSLRIYPCRSLRTVISNAGVFLAVATETSKVHGRVEVLIWSDTANRFVRFQMFNFVGHPRDVRFFLSESGQLYLLLLRKDDNLLIYRFMHASKFVLLDQALLPMATSVNPMQFKTQGEFIAVTVDSCRASDDAFQSDQTSIILRPKYKRAVVQFETVEIVAF